jgi:hypothetical protein
MSRNARWTAVWLVLGVALPAAAQVTGALVGVVNAADTGAPIPGATVTATSPALQGSVQGLSDAQGRFRLDLLPAGDYRLLAALPGYLEAERGDIRLPIGGTLRANLALVPDAVRMEEQVVRAPLPPVVDVASATTGVAIRPEFLSQVPAPRDISGAAAVAPTALRDPLGIGFAGAPSNENAYVIEGLDVANPGFGHLKNDLVTNFVQEMVASSGSFSAENGGSTSGLVAVATKGGSNELHGSLFGSFDPAALHGTAPAIGREAEAITRRDLAAGGAWAGDVGFEVGGPILRDRLWFHAGMAPRSERNVVQRDIRALVFDQATGLPVLDDRDFAVTTPGGPSRRFAETDRSVQYTSKLTWLVNEANTVTLSWFGEAGRGRFLRTAYAAPSVQDGTADRFLTDLVGRYASRLDGGRFLLEALAGWHSENWFDRPAAVDGVDQADAPLVRWLPARPLADFEPVGTACDPVAWHAGLPDEQVLEPCLVAGYYTGGWGYHFIDRMSRLQVRLSATTGFDAGGHHQLKTGLDLRRFEWRDDTRLSGGARITARRTFFDAWSYGTLLDSGLGAGASPGDARAVGGDLIRSYASVPALFLQDAWSPVDGLTVNAGLRLERQDIGLLDRPGASSIGVGPSFSPRAQVIWDPTRQGRAKLSAAWGRFYEVVPLTIGDMSLSGGQAFRQRLEPCFDPAAVVDKTSAALADGPATCPVRPDAYGQGRTYLDQSFRGTVVQPDLEGQYVDQFGVAAELEVLPDLAVGVEYQGRRLGAVIEDLSTDDAASYFIANPGTGRPFQADDGSGTLVTYDPRTATSTDPVTGRSFTQPFPRPRRDYDALTFQLRKSFSRRWQLLASYTWSSLRGNYSGLIRPETGQVMPNISTDFDLASLLANRTGPLPYDRPHQVKVFGSRAWDLGPRLTVTGGGGLRVESGVPINYLGTHPFYGTGEGYLLPRGSGGRTPLVTQVDLRATVRWALPRGLALSASVDVFNALDAETVTTVDERWTRDDVGTLAVQGGQCLTRHGAEARNPIAGALRDCPDLAYVKTLDGRPATINKNFGRPTAYQDPRSFRFGLELSF